MRVSLPLIRPLVAIALPLVVLACVAASRPAPATRPAASAPAGPWVWISNEGSGDVTLLDASRDEVVARIAVGKRPRGLRLDGESGLLYAAVSGSPRPEPGLSPAFEGAADRGADGIAVVDVATRRLVAILPSGQDPGAFDLVPGQRLLVVSNEQTASAAIVDVAAGRLVAIVPVGDEPEGVTASPDGKLVAVTSERGHRVDFLDPAARQVAGRVETCEGPRSVVFTPDGTLAFAACEDGGAVAVLDAVALRGAGEIPLPAGSRPMGLAMDREGKRLFVSNGRAGTVSVVDVASRRAIATSAKFGRRVGGIALAPDGRRLYVADGPANEVAVLDAASLALLRRVQVGALPWAIAVAR